LRAAAAAGCQHAAHQADRQRIADSGFHFLSSSIAGALLRPIIFVSGLPASFFCGRLNKPGQDYASICMGQLVSNSSFAMHTSFVDCAANSSIAAIAWAGEHPVDGWENTGSIAHAIHSP